MDARAKRVVLIAAVAIIIAIIGWAIFVSREPAYNGKPLSAWAEQYGSNHWSANRAAADEAELAIRKIGTNCIPFLLELMRTTDPPLKKKLRDIVPRNWHDALHLKDESGKIRRIGAHGLNALGTNAPAAVAPLVEIARHHPDGDGRYMAVFALSRLGPAAEPAVPFLIQCLTNNDATIRNEGATGLVLIPSQWQNALPPLIQYLESIKSSSGWEIMHGISLLAQLGTNARPAMPLLLSMLNHSDPAVRDALTNHLWRIDEVAAEKAHVMRLQ